MKETKTMKKQIVLLLSVGAVAAVVLYLPEIWEIVKRLFSVCKPIFGGLFLAMILNIPTQFFISKVYTFNDKWNKLSSPLSVATTYILFFALIALIIYIVIPPLIDSITLLKNNLPGYLDNISDWILKMLHSAGVSDATIEEWKQRLLEQGNNLLNNLSEQLPALLSVISRSTTGFMNVFFSLIFSIYFVTDQKRIKKQFHFLTVRYLKPRRSESVLYATSLFSKVFSSFIGGQITVAVVLGIINFLGMLAMGMPYAPLVSVVVMLCNIIPVLGSYFACAIGMFIVALVDIKLAIAFLAFTLVVQQLEANFIYPKVVGDSLGLSAFWVLTAVVVGGGLFGVWGIMLGVPIVAVAYKLFERSKINSEQPTVIASTNAGDSPIISPDDAPNDTTADVLNDSTKDDGEDSQSL